MSVVYNKIKSFKVTEPADFSACIEQNSCKESLLLSQTEATSLNNSLLAGLGPTHGLEANGGLGSHAATTWKIPELTTY